jgi:hypothetical protein
MNGNYDYCIPIWFSLAEFFPALLMHRDDEALRPGIYSLIDVCSDANKQQLYTFLGWFRFESGDLGFSIIYFFFWSGEIWGFYSAVSLKAI